MGGVPNIIFCCYFLARGTPITQASFAVTHRRVIREFDSELGGAWSLMRACPIDLGAATREAVLRWIMQSVLLK